MAQFYGKLKGARGQATRCGTKNSGMTATVASWGGAVQVSVGTDTETEEDWYVVNLIPWGHGSESRELAQGIFGVRQKNGKSRKENAEKENGGEGNVGLTD